MQVHSQQWLFTSTSKNYSPIADAHKECAEKVLEELDNNGIRAELGERQEKIGYKIREAQLQKIPYMLIIGDKEVEANCSRSSF